MAPWWCRRMAWATPPKGRGLFWVIIGLMASDLSNALRITGTLLGIAPAGLPLTPGSWSSSLRSWKARRPTTPHRPSPLAPGAMVHLEHTLSPGKGRKAASQRKRARQRRPHTHTPRQLMPGCTGFRGRGSSPSRLLFLPGAEAARLGPPFYFPPVGREKGKGGGIHQPWAQQGH